MTDQERIAILAIAQQLLILQAIVSTLDPGADIKSGMEAVEAAQKTLEAT